MDTGVEKDALQDMLTARKKVHAPSNDELPDRTTSVYWHGLTHWETWDWRVKYILIFPIWIWLCLRSRSLWFFTSANPAITFGGFDGERKSQVYHLLPPDRCPKYVCISPAMSIADLKQQIAAAGLGFPLAVKPDIGKMGLMFRKANSMEYLKRYHQKMFCDYIIQEWINYPLEVSVFYYRTPGSDKGHITGFVKKEFLEVTGDGHSTLWDLIVRNPRTQFRLEEMKGKHRNRLADVLKQGEKYCLSPALNLSRGGKLVSLEHEKDEKLLSVFDNLSHYTGSLYFGRYDIKCQSIEDLKNGKNFSILEYNGSGAEPHHVYGNGNSLLKACRILVAHWNILYHISRTNHKANIRYWTFADGWRFLRQTGRHLRALKCLDAETMLDVV